MFPRQRNLAVGLDQSRETPGLVFWINGLSGADKMTIGERLWHRLRAAGHPAIFLDGDKLRSVIAVDLRYVERKLDGLSSIETTYLTRASSARRA
jgi:adenylylsulfate kinase-like enzyme